MPFALYLDSALSIEAVAVLLRRFRGRGWSFPFHKILRERPVAVLPGLSPLAMPSGGTRGRRASYSAGRRGREIGRRWQKGIFGTAICWREVEDFSVLGCRCREPG